MAGLYSLNAVRASSKVFTQDIKAIKERSKSKTREKIVKQKIEISWYIRTVCKTAFNCLLCLNKQVNIIKNGISHYSEATYNMNVTFPVFSFGRRDIWAANYIIKQP